MPSSCGMGLVKLAVRHVEKVIHYDGRGRALEVVDSCVWGLHVLVVVDFVDEDRWHFSDVPAPIS